MIRVRYRRNEFAHSLLVVGHAGYSDEGKDIVCSGVSAVVYALLGFLHNSPDREDRLTASVDSGETMIFWRGTGADITAAFHMALIGLAQIAQKYPDNVSMEATEPSSRRTANRGDEKTG